MALFQVRSGQVMTERTKAEFLDYAEVVEVTVESIPRLSRYKKAAKQVSAFQIFLKHKTIRYFQGGHQCLFVHCTDWGLRCILAIYIRQSKDYPESLVGMAFQLQDLLEYDHGTNLALVLSEKLKVI